MDKILLVNACVRPCSRTMELTREVLRKLQGSIEIAPILGLSDVIVDIVETGTTLYENNLEVLETIVPISARLISNKVSFKFRNREIDAIVKQLRKTIKE